MPLEYRIQKKAPVRRGWFWVLCLNYAAMEVFLVFKRRQKSQTLRSSSPAYLCLASQFPKLKNHKCILNKQAAVLETLRKVQVNECFAIWSVPIHSTFFSCRWLEFCNHWLLKLTVCFYYIIIIIQYKQHCSGIHNSND